MEFFTKAETQSQSRPDGKVYSCASCGLYNDVESPRMEPFGNFSKGIMNIGEAPGATEDKKGKQWQGKVGKSLQRAYKKLGIDLFEDCINVNAIDCRPPDNRTPTNYEIACCRKRIFEAIKQYKPQTIVLFGNSALQSLLSHRWKSGDLKITKWRGWTIPDRDIGAWICPTFHPSFVTRNQGGLTDTIWMQDLERVIKTNIVSFPMWEDETKHVQIIDDLSVLKSLSTRSFPDSPVDIISFDYETTGLKPHAKGHRIICASIATSPTHCYTFMMPKSKKARQPFIDLLADKSIGKMAHNMKFEETWSQVRLGQGVENWQWDSMQAAHILDNRTGITGLKFQVYVNFGVIDYAEEVTPYLKSKNKKDGNSHNRILELLKMPDGKRKLLTYGGLDSLFEFRLAQKQMEEINNA